MKKIELFLKDHGYYPAEIDEAERSYFRLNIDSNDMHELSLTRLKSWTAELDKTFNAEVGEIFLIKSKNFSGSLAFGCEPISDKAAFIWLLQTRDFKRNSARYFGRSWPILALRFGKLFIAEASIKYDNLFNFIPSTRIDMIRILHILGFSFHKNLTYSSNFVYFGRGPQSDEIAQSSLLWENYRDA